MQLSFTFDVITRACTKCGVEYGLEGFHKEKRGRYGRKSVCKGCCYKQTSSWARSNRERANAWARESYAANREKMLARAAGYRDANRDKIRAAERARYRDGKHKKQDPERRAATVAKHGCQPHVRAAHAARQLVRGRKLRGNPIDPLVVLEMSDSCCGICGEDIVGDFHVDHVIPIARGGWHALDNLQAAHPICNVRKGDRL